MLKAENSYFNEMTKTKETKLICIEIREDISERGHRDRFFCFVLFYYMGAFLSLLSPSVIIWDFICYDKDGMGLKTGKGSILVCHFVI